jgi:Xaa-Pro aminopeptidase
MKKRESDSYFHPLKQSNGAFDSKRSPYATCNQAGKIFFGGIKVNRREEIAVKEKRLRAFMESSGLKGVLLKRQPNYSWITAGGMNMVSISTDIGFSSLLVTEKEKFCVANRIEASRNMVEEGLEDLGFSLLDYEWYEGSEKECVKKVVPVNKVGCDIPQEGMRFVGDEVNRLRYSLTAPEMERYAWLGEKTSEAVESVLKEIKPGNTEAEITGELTRLLWKHRIDQVGYQAAADDRVYKYRHPIPTERKIDKYVMLCVMARKWGLITTITRLLSFGGLSAKLKKQYEDNVFIECAMVAATRPGEKTGNIFNKAKDLYEKLGYSGEWKLHHQGGAMGYDIREYICNAESTDVVQENQCFCWNPSISGTKSEDGFIAQKEGFVFITKPVLFPLLRIQAEGIEFTRPNILER